MFVSISLLYVRMVIHVLSFKWARLTVTAGDFYFPGKLVCFGSENGTFWRFTTATVTKGEHYKTYATYNNLLKELTDGKYMQTKYIQ